MTSKRHVITSCYIFIDIGDSPILAGRYMIDNEGLGHFTYGKSYVANPYSFPLDPINLPFTEPLSIFHPANGKSVFGVLSDGTPDSWGRKVISSIHRSSPENEVEWLLASHGNGIGCIMANASQTAPQKQKSLSSFDEVEEFLSMADAFAAGKNIPEELIHLAEAGSSMGGLRPKLTLQYKGEEWIVKVNRIDDKFDVSKVEYATMQMAKMSGINIPEIELKKIKNRSVLLVKRFDRNVASRKLHYISAHSLINAHRINLKDTAKNYSYMGIADIAKRITAEPKKEQEQLYRRMVFNVLSGNTDDHMKNHGFLMTEYKKKLYSLSPAFDVLPYLDAPQKLQSIGIGEYGREASIENLVSAHGRFSISENKAKKIIEEVQEVISKWRKYYAENDVLASDISILESCFIVNN